MEHHFKAPRKGKKRGQELYASLADHLQMYIDHGDVLENGCIVYPTPTRYLKVKHAKRSRNFGTWLLESRGADTAVMVARHTCDNSQCINPTHIIAGTQRDNVYDLLQRGSANHILQGKGRSKKLTPEQVHQLRTLYSSGQYTWKQLSQMFHVSMGSMHWFIHHA